MTQCCRFVVRYGFDARQIASSRGRHGIRRAARSRAARLQVRRDLAPASLYGTFIDHAMYSLLRSEYDEAEES
jgi:hypothetical protein